MAPKTLRVRAHGAALVHDVAALYNGVDRYVGRPFKRLEGGDYEHLVNEEPTELPYDAHYVLAVRSGDLLAADEETAKACGVAWKEGAK